MRTVVPRPDGSMKILAPVEMLAVRLAAPVASGWLALGFTLARYVSIHYRSTHERDGASDPVRIASRGVVDLIEIKAIAALPSLFALQALRDAAWRHDAVAFGFLNRPAKRAPMEARC
jgi:hypothetical protein